MLQKDISEPLDFAFLTREKETVKEKLSYLVKTNKDQPRVPEEHCSSSPQLWDSQSCFKVPVTRAEWKHPATLVPVATKCIISC